MAVNKTIETASISIEIQKGIDRAGDPVYSKKSFSNVKPEASPENVYLVAQAIKNVMEASTRDSYLNETSSLTEN